MLTSLSVREHFTLLWKNEQRVLDLLYGTMKEGKRVSSPEIFFLYVLAVPPSRFRPSSKLGDLNFEHPQNGYLVNIIKSNLEIAQIQEEESVALAKDPSNSQLIAAFLNRKVDKWMTLQTNIEYLIDSSNAPLGTGGMAAPGIKQVLEKKEGLFRKHMMGKRVGYSARSVISPDPYIETNEIGVYDCLFRSRQFLQQNLPILSRFTIIMLLSFERL